MVSGAGVALGNGLYTLTGTRNDKPYYTNLSNYEIYYRSFDAKWVIEVSTEILYVTTQPNLTTPLNTTWQSTLDAFNPPPVEVSVAYSVQVSGAGTAAANGIYIFDGVYNNFPFYVMDGNVFYSIYKSDSGANGVWIIASEATQLYENNLSGLISPYNIINPWTRSFTSVFGASPAPTVTPYPIQ
jgi:hypothetical protein